MSGDVAHKPFANKARSVGSNARAGGGANLGRLKIEHETQNSEKGHDTGSQVQDPDQDEVQW